MEAGEAMSWFLSLLQIINTLLAQIKTPKERSIDRRIGGRKSRDERARERSRRKAAREEAQHVLDDYDPNQ